jgi:magnesium chelatase family protein
MLFKTQSASIYGIDAYLVEVEVDVGSARMQDFNVVGLPDNAVKESRERIKSALRNCGFEFPHNQGVTINLAPADVRKEGSAFDLPMALGLVGCMGHFFGKQLNQCMFLGELSLDGSIRSVRGALSAAVAAREVGLKSLAVPEANAREAAVVEGVNVFALKTLPQAVDLVNAPESFQPVVVDAKQMLSEAAQHHRRPGCLRKHRSAPPQRSHPIPHPGPLLLGLVAYERLLMPICWDWQLTLRLARPCYTSSAPLT